MLRNGNLSAFVALNALVEVEAQPIFHIAASIEHCYRPNATLEIIMFNLVNVARDLPTRVRLAEYSPTVMKKKEYAKCHRDNCGPEQHALAPERCGRRMLAASETFPPL